MTQASPYTAEALQCIRQAINSLDGGEAGLADALRLLVPATPDRDSSGDSALTRQEAADLFRDSALALKYVDPHLAASLVTLALGIRPNGPRLQSLRTEIRALMEMISSGRCTIRGKQLEFGVTPPAALLRALFTGTYERQEADLVRQFIADGEIVLELGAGLGYLGISAISTGRCSRYVAYEANPGLIPLIERNMATNQARFELHHGLLGGKVGRCEFHLAPDFWASSLIRPDGSDYTTVQVPCFDKNEVIRALSPTMLVVDIEGGESELFADWDIQGVRKIILEIHPWTLSDRKLSELHRSLLENGFFLNFKASYKNVLYWYRPAI